VCGTMGSVPGGKALQDGISSVSPWLTLVQIENQTSQPVVIFLARNPDEPHPEDAIEHVIPANNTYGLPSGWLREPRATLLIRTGVDEAQLLRVPNNAKLQIRLAPHGLKVESTDSGIEVEMYEPAQVVPGHDTVPMVFRGESFNVAPAAGPSVAQQAIQQEEGGSPTSPMSPVMADASAFQEPCSPVVAPPPAARSEEPTSPAIAPPPSVKEDSAAERVGIELQAPAETAPERDATEVEATAGSELKEPNAV
ncbi:ycf45, partial [Symbiodinium microadriaticum]